MSLSHYQDFVLENKCNYKQRKKCLQPTIIFFLFKINLLLEINLFSSYFFNTLFLMVVEPNNINVHCLPQLLEVTKKNIEHILTKRVQPNKMPEVVINKKKSRR